MRKPPSDALQPRSNAALCLLIALAVFICFGNLVRAEFSLWDDPFNISLNPHMNPPSGPKIWWYWYSPAYSLYIPVTYTVWGILASVSFVPTADQFGVHLNPMIFHGASVLCHAIAAMAAFAILSRLFANRWAACLGALVFALHPVQVEAVGWAAGLKDVLYGMFALIAIGQYLAAVDPQPSEPRWNRHVRYVVATFVLILAMLSKPTAMVAPVIALVIDLCMFRRPGKRVLLSIWPWLLLSVACAIVARRVQPAVGIPRAPMWSRPFVAGDTLAFYLYKLVFPVWLGIDYGRRPLLLLSHGWFYLTCLVPLALFAWLWWNRKSRPALWVAGLVFAIGVAPVSGLVTFLFQYYSTVADHYLYLAMLGPAIAAAYVLSQSWRPVFIAVASIALALLGARTILQTQTWQDDEALNRNAMAVYADSFLGHNNLGHYYTQLGRIDEALPLFRRSVELRPDNWQAQENLGWVLADKGDVDEAIEHIDKSIRFKSLMQLPETPKLADDYVHLGDVLMQRNRYAAAADKFRKALELDPNHELAKRNLAIALEKMNQPTSSTTRLTTSATTSTGAPSPATDAP